MLVLLLGEIDLSAGAVSGLSAAVMAILNVKTVGAGALAAGGTGHGRGDGPVPRPVDHPVARALLRGDAGRTAGWQGALLFVLGDTGTVNLNDDRSSRASTGTFFGPTIAWPLAA